jgi:hypothetical protein
LPSPVDEDLELVLAAPPDERHASLLDEVGREQLVGHDRCRNARPVQGATIDVD